VEFLAEEELEEVLGEEPSLGEGLGAEKSGLGEEWLTEEVEILDEKQSEGLAGQDGEATGLLEEEVELLAEEELEEIPAEDPSPGEGLGAGESELDEEWLTEEVEILDEEQRVVLAGQDGETTGLLEEEVEILAEEELEEVPAEEPSLGEGLGAGESGLDEEWLTEEVEILDEEVEILAEEEPAEIAAPAEPQAETSHRSTPLEVLSKYIEAEEALREEDLLRETQEGFINQLLARFMPKFVRIPAGVYLVGSPSPTGLEQPLRKVRLPDFHLGQAPVTNDLFEMFVRETGYVTEAEEAGYGTVFEGRCTSRQDPETGRQILSLNRASVSRQVHGANWRHPGGPDSSLKEKHNHPVVQVSCQDAMAFAAWAGKRLPTEDEWEAAARSPSGQLFPWGDSWLAGFGNFEGGCLGGTTPVEHFGCRAMSPFGIHDLLGNVAEWTSTSLPEQAEPQPGKSTERIHILKGGSWITGGIVTAAWRQIEQGKYWANTIGFRCAV
jgi:formylglycine-generating enzyme required for sulfatase activity